MTVACYPAYSASTLSNWYYGSAGSASTGTVVSSALGTDVGWVHYLNKFPMQPGRYYMTTFQGTVGYADAVNTDTIYFVVYTKGGTTYSPVTLSNGLTYIDITANQPANINFTNMSAALGDVYFDLEAGKTYYYGLQMKGITGHENNGPQTKTLLADNGPQGQSTTHSIKQTARPTVLTSVTDGTGSANKFSLYFKTAVRKLLISTYAAADKVFIPYRYNADWVVKFGSAVVADGENFTCKIEYVNGSSEATEGTLVLDMGATDRVTFGGQNVALAAAAAEAGDTFDLLLNVRYSGTKWDLFYQNRTSGQGPAGADTDLATISHCVAYSGTRGSASWYDFTNQPVYLNMTGTATVATIEVGYEPLVLFGDSQVSLADHRYAEHLPGAFTYPRIYWLAALGGGSLITSLAGHSTAGYLRYKSTTPGQGDLCEMTGVVFVFCGYGVNDFTAYADTDVERNGRVMEWIQRAAEIICDLQVNANQCFIIALPPYSAVTANVHMAQCIKNQFNVALEGLAIGSRSPFLNPWWDMVVQSAANDDVPTFNTTYCTDTVHYNTVGAAAVSALAVKAFESNSVGGPWTKRNTRGRRPGLLLPI
jgi:hypothetical protein